MFGPAAAALPTPPSPCSVQIDPDSLDLNLILYDVDPFRRQAFNRGDAQRWRRSSIYGYMFRIQVPSSFCGEALHACIPLPLKQLYGYHHREVSVVLSCMLSPAELLDGSRSWPRTSASAMTQFGEVLGIECRCRRQSEHERPPQAHWSGSRSSVGMGRARAHSIGLGLNET